MESLQSVLSWLTQGSCENMIEATLTRHITGEHKLKVPDSTCGKLLDPNVWFLECSVSVFLKLMFLPVSSWLLFLKANTERSLVVP